MWNGVVFYNAVWYWSSQARSYAIFDVYSFAINGWRLEPFVVLFSSLHYYSNFSLAMMALSYRTLTRMKKKTSDPQIFRWLLTAHRTSYVVFLFFFFGSEQNKRTHRKIKQKHKAMVIRKKNERNKISAMDWASSSDIRVYNRTGRGKRKVKRERCESKAYESNTYSYYIVQGHL